MHHFFVDRSQVENTRIVVEGSDVNHIRNVLRLKPGENILVSDGSNTAYTCRIDEYQDRTVLCEILSREEAYTELPSAIYLFQGLPKADKMELIIQKAVELGVTAVIPVAAGRSVVKLDKKKEESRLKRWNSIAESAAKQSGRMFIPQVLPVMSFEKAVERMEMLTHRLIPYELCEGMEETRQIIGRIRPGDSIGIMIGPEGGFEKEEISCALTHGILPVTLGGRILRTETAGMCLLSILMFMLEQRQNVETKKEEEEYGSISG